MGWGRLSSVVVTREGRWRPRSGLGLLFIVGGWTCGLYVGIVLMGCGERTMSQSTNPKPSVDTTPKSTRPPNLAHFCLVLLETSCT